MNEETSVPDVQLWWEKDGRTLQPPVHIKILKNGYLYTESVMLGDAGFYTCVAQDASSGCMQKVSASLKVNEAAKIEDSKFPLIK